ncbi:hypothetical protein FOPG_11488 [Fusarium oxysporum f. sp. conglutinans race 2 54008]|uniref:Uncharacterized protein n=1 Tax=Fusarium oxysporum f. sp. conglutinans race 2 54008 TaxID=1089457 RepID=X0IJ32_FUSOX|nr:hypothetical protein FOPG_11488 [Fusarium oxysporum f. sp. conglutinans race 2 54008]
MAGVVRTMEFIYLMAMDLANSDTSAPSESKQSSNPDDKESAPDTGSERPGYSAVRSDANSEPDNTSDHAIDRPKKKKTSNASILVKNGMARDIFGWTPFYYATARVYV